jgi:HSP20 family molecular chaperone IbpA
MAITRWDPFRDVVALQNRVNSLFRDFSEEGDNALSTATFVPAVDIYENAQQIVLKLEVPGLEEKDLDGQGRAQVRERGERGELPSHRAALRELLPCLHAAVDR